MAFLNPRCAAILALACGAFAMASAPDREHRVKAVFLYNFAQFVAWPGACFQNDSDAIVVGVLGEDPFSDFLDEVVRGEKIGKRPIVVHRYKRPEDVKACHVLFVSPSERNGLDSVLESLRARHVLTVGETPGFLKSGGMVALVTEDGKVHLKINLEAVQGADLTVSSKLLRLAEVTQAEKD